MASRFWVGGSGNWDASDTTHWSATSGGAAGASVPSSSDDVTFDSNSGTTATATITGVTANANSITINKSDLTLLHNAGSTVVGAVTLTIGTLNTNGQTCSWGSLVSNNSSTRAITLGASTITITGVNAPWTCTTGTNLTLDAGTSSIVLNPVSGTPTFQSGGKTYYDLSIIKSAGGLTVAGGPTFHNVTVDNTVLGSGNRAFAISVDITVNGTITYIGNDTNPSRGLMQNGTTLGFARTIALGTTGTAVLTNVDIRDIAFTGTNTPVTGTSIADCGGNSGITFTPQVTRYWVGDSGSMSDPAHWSATSGGASGATAPIPHDTANFDANSFTTSGRVVTSNQMRTCTLDWTGVTNNPAFNFINPNGAGNDIYGSVTYVTGMSLTVNSAAGGNSTTNLRGRGSRTYNQAGLVPPSNYTLQVNCGTGVYTLGGNLVLDSTKTLTLSTGTLAASTFNVTVGLFNASTTTTRTLDMGSGVWTLTGAGVVWQLSTMTALTFSAGSSTLIISDTSSSSKTFSHGSAIVMNDILILGGGTGQVIFGANLLSLRNFITIGPKTLQFTAGGGSTTTLTGKLTLQGSSGNLVTLESLTASSPFFFSKAAGNILADYLSLKDSTATGGAAFYAGANSTNVSGNTGWSFTTPTLSSPKIVITNSR